MKKFILPFLALLLFSNLSNAQSFRRNPDRFLEIGVLLGLTNYSGDVAENSVELAETQPGFGIYARYHVNRLFGFKAHSYFGSITGDDKHSETRKIRSFKFQTNITELGLVMEYKPFGRERTSSTGIHVFNFTPYVFVGAGVTFAEADARYYGADSLRNEYLRTPLPEDGLKTTFITTPIGLGIRADIADRIILGAEGGWRPVYSDHLDGIRINGNPDKGDWYYFLGVTVSIVLSTRDRGMFN